MINIYDWVLIQILLKYASILCSERGEKVLKLISTKGKKIDGKPEKTSVSLRLMQVIALLESSEHALKALANAEETQIHLGRCTYLRTWVLPRETIDIRDHFYPEEDTPEPLPTGRGIRLYGLEIQDFFDVLPIVKEVWPLLIEKPHCSVMHADDRDVVHCYNCNPRFAGTPRHLRK